MRRDQWFDQLSRETVAMLPSQHRAFLDQIPNLEVPHAPSSPILLGQAALIAHICLGYRNALSANELSEELIRRGLAPVEASPREVLDCLVRPVFQALRLGRLPLDEWWWPEQLHFLVFMWYSRWRLAGTQEDLLREDLAERWGLSHGDIQTVIGEALLPASVIPQLLHEPASDARLAGFWERKDISQTLREEIAKVPAGLALHDELFEMALAAARLRVLRAHRAALVETVEEFEALLARTGEELEVNLTRFTGYELHRVRELDVDEQLLHASVNALRNVHHASSVGTNTPAEGYLDGLLVPDWLTEYVVSAGGRIGHRSCGPIPYWFAVFDVADLPDEVLSGQAQTRIAVGEVHAESGLGKFVVQLHFRGEERVAEFYFADALDQAMQLALIALTGFVRLDFFNLRDDGLLELIHTARYDVSETPLSASARRGALNGLRSQNPDPDALLNAWFQEHAADFGMSGFIGSDWAKAEELLGLGASASDDAESEGFARYLNARERWLTASDELARARLVRTDVAPLEWTVADALADYRLARGDCDHRTSIEAEQERFEALAEGLVDAETAFLHLNRSQDYLVGFLCVHGSNGPVALRLDLSATPLRAIENALDSWREAEPESLRHVMQSVGRGLGQVIADALREHRVNHVFVSPLGFLSELPLCVLELEDGRYLGDLVSISYAPSARVLQRLREQGSTTATGVVAVAFQEEDDIPMTNSEVAALDALHAEVVTLLGPGATPQALLGAVGDSRLLHLACHGTWRLGDAYGSGLHLAGDTLANGYLSVAQLYRDADLSSVELVVLSACDTGRALTRWPQIENYTGIDGAFLACGARSVISSLWEVDDLAGLLFSVALHQALADNASLVQAFALGVQMLRSGRYLSMDGSPEAKLLDAVAAGWREDVEAVGEELKDPYYWAVFKLSGLIHA